MFQKWPYPVGLNWAIMNLSVIADRGFRLNTQYLRASEHAQNQECQACDTVYDQIGMQDPVKPFHAAILGQAIVEADNGQSTENGCEKKHQFRGKRENVGALNHMGSEVPFVAIPPVFLLCCHNQYICGNGEELRDVELVTGRFCSQRSVKMVMIHTTAGTISPSSQPNLRAQNQQCLAKRRCSVVRNTHIRRLITIRE